METLDIRLLACISFALGLFGLIIADYRKEKHKSAMVTRLGNKGSRKHEYITVERNRATFNEIVKSNLLTIKDSWKDSKTIFLLSVLVLALFGTLIFLSALLPWFIVKKIF